MKRSIISPALFLIFILTGFFGFGQSKNSSAETLPFPFIERFTNGSLETNNWLPECDNWAIDTDASDIRLPTLWRIIRKGLGGNLNLTTDF